MIRRRTHRLVAWVDEQTYNTVKNYCQYHNADQSEYMGELLARGLKDRNEDYRQKVLAKMEENDLLMKRLKEFQEIHVQEDAVGLYNEKKYDKLMIIKRNDFRDTYAAMELRDMLVFMGVESWGEFTEILLDAIKDGEIWIEGGKVVRRKTSQKAQRAQLRAGLIKKVDKWCRIGGEDGNKGKIYED